jgi:hypothetical protein
MLNVGYTVDEIDYRWSLGSTAIRLPSVTRVNYPIAAIQHDLSDS